MILYFNAICFNLSARSPSSWLNLDEENLDKELKGSMNTALISYFTIASIIFLSIQTIEVSNKSLGQ